MKFVAITILALIAAVALAVGAVDDPGHVIIGYRGWSVETSLAFLVLALLFTFVVLYYGIRALVGFFHMPSSMRAWNEERHAMKARTGLNQGLIKLAAGDWQGAEKQLLKQIEYSDDPTVNYLAAARAAQKQGSLDRRDRYLLSAHQQGLRSSVAVRITQAELQIANRQLEQALATLTQLRETVPGNRHVLELLMRVYIKVADWNHLIELLPDLRKRKVITNAEADHLEGEAHVVLLGNAAESGELDLLKDAWGRVPRRLTRDENLQLTYAGQLQKLGAGAEAEALVRGSLKRHWSRPLVSFYGQLEGADSTRQLTGAEDWLKGHETDPELLLSLGRLAMRNQLWGKARSYVESSVGIAPTVEGYQLLASLLERSGEQREAAENYRKAALMAAEGEVLPPASAATDKSEESKEAAPKPALTGPEE